MSSAARAIEETIAEQADLLTWITTGIFVLSLFSSIMRSDPTLAICLFGFYGGRLHSHACAPQLPRPCPPSSAGAHVRSKGAVRSFWVFLSLSLVVDSVWMAESSGLSPLTWEQLEQLQRQARAPTPLPPATGPCPHRHPAGHAPLQSPWR